MGVTIMGIGTKADEQTIVKALTETLAKRNHTFSAELDSEPHLEALVNRKPDKNIVDLYATPSGTVCVMSLELFEILSKRDLSTHFDFVYFDISETDMSHRFALFSKGDEGLCMNIWDYGNFKNIKGDNFLDIKNEEDIFQRVFPRAVDQYLPQTFHAIDPSTKIKRYKLV